MYYPLNLAEHPGRPWALKWGAGTGEFYDSRDDAETMIQLLRQRGFTGISLYRWDGSQYVREYS
jgi:hypothetical protein